MIIRTLAILCFFISVCANSQVVAVSGESQIEISRELSQAQTEKKAEDMAIINALEKAFGKVVFQGNSTVISNIQTGKNIETTTAFNMVGNTYVKGECLEVLSKKFEEVEGEKRIDGKKTKYKELKCVVKIKAREITTPPVNFDAWPLKQEDKNYQTTSFKNNQSMYFYFNSPSDGYLNIFFDDNKNTYRLFPHSNMPANCTGGFPVEPDKDYILFSAKEQFNYIGEGYLAPGEMILVTDKSQELNRLFIVYSKQAIDKPRFKKNLADEVLTAEELNKNLTIPDGMESEDFQRWLQKNRFMRNDIQLKIIDITISNR